MIEQQEDTFESLLAEKWRLEGAIADEKSGKSKRKKDIDDLNREKDDLEAERRSLEVEIDDIDEKIEELKKEIEDREGEPAQDGLEDQLADVLKRMAMLPK